MDYNSIKKELLIALRGDLTQKKMSEKLGFRFNQYHKWETDLKWLRWDEFIDILKISSPNYQNAFKNTLTYYEDPKNLKQFFKVLCADLSLKEIGSYVGHDEAVVRRWIKKQISPSVETIFKLIHDRTNNFCEFINQLTDINKIPSVAKKYLEIQRQKKVEVIYPFASAIEACLQLEEYQKLPSHSDTWVSNRILVSEALVRGALEALLKAGTVIKRENKYVVNNQWIQMPGLTPEEVVKVDQYWTHRCLDRYNSPTGVPYIPEVNNTNIRSFRIAPLSSKASKEIQATLRQASQEILKIIQTDNEKKDKVAVYVSHFFDVEDIKWTKTES